MNFRTLLSDPALLPLLLLYFFLVGTVIGSFLNVCIYRIPLGVSIVTPRSKCPNCGNVIPWYCNIPLFSYLFLLGKCKFCKARISPVYPLVELMTGLFVLLLFRHFGVSRLFFIYLYFGCCMIVLMFIDYYHRILPHKITMSGVVIGLACSFFIPALGPFQSLCGVVLGAALPGLVYLVYKWVRKKEGMGQGDIVMLAMIGAFLGCKQVFLVLLASSVLGSIVGILGILLFRKGSQFEWPFGTFIAIAALADIFWGPLVWAFYFRI